MRENITHQWRQYGLSIDAELGHKRGSVGGCGGGEEGSSCIQIGIVQGGSVCHGCGAVL